MPKMKNLRCLIKLADDSSREVVSFKEKVDSLIDDLSSFTLGHDNLIKLAGNNGAIYDKSYLGHDQEN